MSQRHRELEGMRTAVMGFINERNRVVKAFGKDDVGSYLGQANGLDREMLGLINRRLRQGGALPRPIPNATPRTARPVIWGDPPPSAPPVGRGGRIARLVEDLKERPGEWCRDSRTHAGTAVAYRLRSRYPGTEWRVEPDPESSGYYIRYNLWGRWVGPGEAT